MTGTNQETFDKIKIKFLMIIVLGFLFVMAGQYFGFVPLFVSDGVVQNTAVVTDDVGSDVAMEDEYMEDDYDGVYSDYSEYDLGFDDGYFYGYDDGYMNGYEEAKSELAE